MDLADCTIFADRGEGRWKRGETFNPTRDRALEFPSVPPLSTGLFAPVSNARRFWPELGGRTQHSNHSSVTMLSRFTKTFIAIVLALVRDLLSHPTEPQKLTGDD